MLDTTPVGSRMLLAQVGKIEQNLSSGIITGRLWLNNADAALKQICYFFVGPPKP